MLWPDQHFPCGSFSLCHVQTKSCPRYATNRKMMLRNSMADLSDIPEPDLESGPRTTSLLSDRADPISISSRLPSRAQISLHDGTHNHLRSIRPTPQRATNQLQNFGMLVPNLTFATVEPSSESAIELYQVTHLTRLISYNRSWD